MKSLSFSRTRPKARPWIVESVMFLRAHLKRFPHPHHPRKISSPPKFSPEKYTTNHVPVHSITSALNSPHVSLPCYPPRHFTNTHRTLLNATTSPLLRLRAELRNTIYTHALAYPSVQIFAPGWGDSHSTPRFSVAGKPIHNIVTLPLVNHQLRTETKFLAYTLGPLEGDICAMIAVADHVPLQLRVGIKKLVMTADDGVSGSTILPRIDRFPALEKVVVVRKMWWVVHRLTEEAFRRAVELREGADVELVWRGDSFSSR